MKKWQLAKYLIEAKTSVDSLMFIRDNQDKLYNLDLQKKITTLRQSFYLNCCFILDKCFSTKEEKKEIKENNNIISKVYCERNKNVAHKDKGYKPQNFNSPDKMIAVMKEQLGQVKEVCKDFLPDIISLNYVSHDKELFRYIFKISPDDEECIIKAKYPRVENEFCYIPENYDLLSDSDIEKRLSIIAKQFGLDSIKLNKKETWSADIVKELSDEDKKKIAYLIPNGLNSEEGLQNRQQACIYINIMFNQNIWVYPNDEVLDQIRNMKKDGILDEYETVNWKVANKL